MIEQFLKAKHWQLFLGVFVLPIVFQIIFMVNLFSELAVHRNPDPIDVFKNFAFFPLVFLIVIAINFGWIYSVAIGLQSRIPSPVKMKVKQFKFFFFVPVFYILLILLGMVYLILNVTNGFVPNPLIFVLILPLHFFSIFCMFHNIFFVAKTIKTVEMQREVSFGDFVGEFFAVWFYPIGVWIVQPRINRLFKDQLEEEF